MQFKIFGLSPLDAKNHFKKFVHVFSKSLRHIFGLMICRLSDNISYFFHLFFTQLYVHLLSFVCKWILKDLENMVYKIQVTGRASINS